jgi:hypothetical protein
MCTHQLKDPIYYCAKIGVSSGAVLWLIRPRGLSSVLIGARCLDEEVAPLNGVCLGL